MKNKLKKIPGLYFLLKFIYRKIIRQVQSGYYPGYLLYCMLEKKDEFVQLTSMGFCNIEPFEPKTWKYGRQRDRAHRRYFSAVLDNRKCFIKVASQSDSSVKNEAQIQNYLRQFDVTFTPKCIALDQSFRDNMTLVAVEYIDGLRRFHMPEDAESFDNMCMQFLNIVNELDRIGVIHADIHPGNLMMGADGNLYILDFGISKIRERENSVDYKARPGTYYSVVNSTREYDDVFSFIKMIDSMGFPNEWKKEDGYRSIVACEGRNSFSVKV